MNIWILTIGTSDVQLESTSSSRNKQREDKHFSQKIWSKWARNCEEHWEINFKPYQTFVDENQTYQISPRALGGVYQTSAESTQADIRDYLHFSLLENFLKSFPINPIPDVIFLILTDQSELFSDTLQRRNPKCPYWQDTIELKSIISHFLQTYFQKNYNTEVKIEEIVLNPKDQSESLDDWNAVLTMVQDKFRTLRIDDVELEIEKCDHVYVSHQAGTPAISSAVQFMSLATFRDSVYFLVSRDNQQFSTTKVEPFKLIPQSNYLGALRLQEAKALLQRYDYTGIRDILGLTEAKDLQKKQKEIKILLDAGEQWNFAEFHKFKNRLKNSDLITVTQFPWWQLGYESAYLSLIRLYQENTVDCLFHSFRAIEGLLSQWVHKFHKHALINQSKEIKLSREVQVHWKPYRATQVNSHGQGLYYAFLGLSNLKADEIPTEFHTFGCKVFPKRNKMFHSLSGVEGNNAVFEFWEVENQEYSSLADCLISCLNLISGQNFTKLEDVSLMAKVHDELTKAIDSL